MYIIIMENSRENIIDYIKHKFPKVIFNPINIKLKSENSALGFIITGGKFIMGYIAQNGNFCKLIEPIDLSNIDSDHFIELLKSVPKISTFKESDLTDFINLLSESGKVQVVDKNRVISELEDKVKKYQEKESNYNTYNNVLLNSNGDILLIKSEYEQKIQDIKTQFSQELQNKENDNQKCKDKIIYEKDIIIEAIKNYRLQMDKYITSEKQKVAENYTQIIDKLTSDKKQIEDRLFIIQQNENAKENTKENSGNVEIKKLNETITLIKTELENIKEDYNKIELENRILQNYKSECLDKIINEKDQIIISIKDYTKQWLDWSDKNNYDLDSYKKNLGLQLDDIIVNLNSLLSHKSDYINKLSLDNKTKSQMIVKLQESVDDIKNELKKSATEQLMAMTIKDTDTNSTESDNLKLEIVDLKRELEQVKNLLAKNNNTPIKQTVDYKKCFDTFQKFIMVNNMFYRKKQIMDILDKIIMDPVNISVFTNLSDRIKETIKTNYTTIRTDIYKHIDFLNLSKYINDPNIKLFKSQSTLKNIPEQFCLDLQSISEYWDLNVLEYRNQDRQLTNIFENLSGAVRVYIKVKPLIGIEQKENTVYIETINNKQQNQITVDCSNVPDLDLEIKKKTYSNFYGIFDEYFSNLDVFTGIQNTKIDENKLTVNIDDIIEESDTVHPGLHSSFKQVEDGYSIVIFGYGSSGCGKTRLLMGEQGIPGLMHYGLANLQGVKNIRIKNIFEQYIHKFQSTLKNISGDIYHLVGNIKQLKEVSFDETADFVDNLPVSVNLNNVAIDSLYSLTNALNMYRISQHRIRKTPNNPVSSRSHLYIVFEITFDTDKVGYITIVDTAGRESPIDIYNLFIEPKKDSSGKVSKTSITTILGPTGGVGVVEQFMKSSLRQDYKADDIYNILKEGFYINETINHLIYFFNKKNYRKTKVIKQKESLDNYSTERYYVAPDEEEKSIDGLNNALTIPILKYLDNLSNKKNADEFLPTKFITFVCVRKDQKYCNQIFKSMDFGASVKSS